MTVDEKEELWALAAAAESSGLDSVSAARYKQLCEMYRIDHNLIVAEQRDQVSKEFEDQKHDNDSSCS
jgi:hypothetical protein